METLSLKQQWFGNIRGDILSGLVVALALIPEAIAFSILAGVDPMVGLYASFIIATLIAFVGGRPAMISAATGAMALVIVDLVADYGLQYLLAATILTGMIQILFGISGISKLMRFIPNAVMIGFVNSLAILIFVAQLPHFIGEGLLTYVFIAITLGMLYFLPKYIKVIPAPLIAIVLLTIAVFTLDLDMKTIGDLGTLSNSLPTFLIPNIPWNMETLLIILPYSIGLALVGLMESLMTAQILDEETGTKSNKRQESIGQGIANFVNGFFGGMAGCAMIGQSVINVKSGGRGRLSTLVAGVFLMILILVFGNIVVDIPMPVLVGIMIMVCIGTFDWKSFSYLVKAPKADAFVMLATVAVVLYTNNLAIGVIVGVIFSSLFFVAKISRVNIKQSEDKYVVNGPLFFASTTKFIDTLSVAEKELIIIDFSNCQIWDESAIVAIEKVVMKLKRNGKEVQLIGLNETSKRLINSITKDTLV